MQKRGLVVFSVLILLLLVISVSALEKTKIYGKVDSRAKISLTATYFNNGTEVENVYNKRSDENGNWDFIIVSDPNKTITAKIIYEDIIETYAVPVGLGFKIDLLGYDPEEPKINETVGEAVEATPAGQQEEIIQEQPEEILDKKSNKSVSGMAIFNNMGLSNSSVLGIILVLVALFIVIIVANLASHGIINFVGSRREGKSEPRQVNVVKLSDKLREEKDEKIKERQEGEKRRQKEFEEWRRKQEEKKGQVEKLKEQIRELEKGK